MGVIFRLVRKYLYIEQPIRSKIKERLKPVVDKWASTDFLESWKRGRESR